MLMGKITEIKKHVWLKHKQYMFFTKLCHDIHDVRLWQLLELVQYLETGRMIDSTNVTN